jgi:hypothetical protein
VAAIATGEPHGLDGGVDPARGGADRARQEQEVLAPGQVGRELRRLDDGAHPVDDRRQQMRHRLAEQPHRALGRTGEAEQHPDGGGLA